jgi:hypothetical protein
VSEEQHTHTHTHTPSHTITPSHHHTHHTHTSHTPSHTPSHKHTPGTSTAALRARLRPGWSSTTRTMGSGNSVWPLRGLEYSSCTCVAGKERNLVLVGAVKDTPTVTQTIIQTITSHIPSHTHRVSNGSAQPVKHCCV